MTILTDERATVRETREQYSGRTLVITLHARYMEIAQKGRKSRLPIDYQALWEYACKRQFEYDLREIRNGKR